MREQLPTWARRMIAVLAWATLAVTLLVSFTQLFGIDDRRIVAVLQALTPFVLLSAVPIGAVALLYRKYPMAGVSLVPIITFAVLAAPLVLASSPPSTDDAAPRFTLTFANLLAKNTTPEQAAADVVATGADVLVLGEFTPTYQAAFEQLVGDDYPFRAEHPLPSPAGIAVWSRFPIRTGGVVDLEGRPTVDVVLDVDGRAARVIGVHPSPPTHDAAYWVQQLRDIGDLAADSDLPTVVAGDFNASRWHPSFRELLDRGWTDAHEALGDGWSVSWPTDEGVLPPTFVRLDHALFGDGIAPVKLRDYAVTGSDHEAFMVEFGFTPRGT